MALIQNKILHVRSILDYPHAISLILTQNISPFIFYPKSKNSYGVIVPKSKNSFIVIVPKSKNSFGVIVVIQKSFGVIEFEFIHGDFCS